MVSKMDTGENFVYFQATRGTSSVRNHVFPTENKANIWINIFHKDICDVYKKVSVITMEDTRFLHCNIKTLNLIPAVIASQKAKELGCAETILHRNKRVTECAHSNVHILKDGTFITAPLDNLILPGIARKHLIKACNKLNIPVKEIPYSLDELLSADEIILSSAGQLCTATEKVDGKFVGGKAPELLKTIQDEVYREFLEETN
jgi:D-alanine transaminase